MTATTALDLATIREYCRVLRLATVAAQCEVCLRLACLTAKKITVESKPARP